MPRNARVILAAGGLVLAVGLGSACAAGQPGGASSAGALPGAHERLPDCRSLAQALLQRVYESAQVIAEERVDDAVRSERLCTFNGRAADGRDEQFTVVVARLFADSYDGMPRKRWLRTTAKTSVANLCEGEQHTPGGFQWATACYTPASHGGQASIAVVSGDTKVVVHGGGLSDDEPPGRFRERAKRDVLTVAKALLDAVGR